MKPWRSRIRDFAVSSCPILQSLMSPFKPLDLWFTRVESGAYAGVSQSKMPQRYPVLSNFRRKCALCAVLSFGGGSAPRSKERQIPSVDFRAPGRDGIDPMVDKVFPVGNERDSNGHGNTKAEGKRYLYTPSTHLKWSFLPSNLVIMRTTSTYKSASVGPTGGDNR